jgi:hypothetical protein
VIRSNAIISNMFPSRVQKRIVKDAHAQLDAEMETNSNGHWLLGTTSKIKNFLYDGSTNPKLDPGTCSVIDRNIGDCYVAAAVSHRARRSAMVRVVLLSYPSLSNSSVTT